MSTRERPPRKADRSPKAVAAPGTRPASPAAAIEERLAAHLFDLSPIPAVFSRLEDSTILAMNARTSEIFGVAQAHAAGLRGSDFYVDLTQRQMLIDLLRRDGRADNVRIHLRRTDGQTLWAQASARLVTYGGEPAVLTVFNDISEQVAAEDALKASERRLKAQSAALTELTAQYANPTGTFDERLRTILETAARTLQVDRLGMWRFDASRRTIRCEGLYACGANRHEAGAVLPREAAPAYFDALEGARVIAAADAVSDPRTREFLETYLRPNGIGAMLDVPLRQNNISVGVLCAEHVGGSRAWTIDEQNYAVATANLISMAMADDELREALERLAESNARARLIVDTAHDAFVGVDSTGDIVTWNAQAEKTFGWTAGEAVGLNLVETIIPPAFRDAHVKGMQRFHDTGEAPVLNQRLELTALHKDGREFPIEITITAPIHTREGYFFGAFLRDISDRRERDDQLRLAKESAEAATRAKSEFLANMSHELRTPLNGVLGYAQLLQRDRNLTPGQRDSLDAIAKCGSHLLDLINDILDLSKIEAGFLDIESVATDLAQLAIDLRYVVGESARRKGLLLSMAIAPEVPRRVVLDGRHLRQVLLNLLGNAIKFTARGEVGLRVTVSDEGRLFFEVFDTGIGIESEALEQIFEAFTQTDAGAAAGGTGLGLAISHHLIRSMGDELRVESTPGRGSRFFFALPLVRAADAPPSAEAVDAAGMSDARLEPGQEITALVVDDSTVNRRILAALLESAGVRVITAAGGIEAVRLAQEHRPDVIFMDLKMTDLDGLEAARRIAADPATARIPVIAVTASTLGDRRQAARDAGCADYLPKPVRAESLFAALQTHVGVRFVSAQPAAAAGAAAFVLPAGPQRRGLAERLRAAIAIGDVTDLQGLAQELVAGDAQENVVGQRIARLVSEFDFDGLRDLAATLAVESNEPAC
jgi:two-component system sensor histidine kinase/response regulator